MQQHSSHSNRDCFTYRILLPLLLVLYLGVGTSCNTYRITTESPPHEINAHKKTLWSFAWGLVQPKAIKTTCPEDALQQVEVKTNLGYILISAATVGLVVPIKVEWHCKKEEHDTQTIGN